MLTKSKINRTGYKFSKYHLWLLTNQRRSGNQEQSEWPKLGGTHVLNLDNTEN